MRKYPIGLISGIIACIVAYGTNTIIFSLALFSTLMMVFLPFSSVIRITIAILKKHSPSSVNEKTFKAVINSDEFVYKSNKFLVFLIRVNVCLLIMALMLRFFLA